MSLSRTADIIAFLSRTGDIIPSLSHTGDIMPGSGLLTWVKGAVSTGGLFHRVAEKAKSSVDSMITTLDPQMKEYLSEFKRNAYLSQDAKNLKPR